MQVKKLLGIPGDHKMVLFVFGAHALTLEPSSDWLPDKWICVACTGGKPLSTHFYLSLKFDCSSTWKVSIPYWLELLDFRASIVRSAWSIFPVSRYFANI